MQRIEQLHDAMAAAFVLLFHLLHKLLMLAADCLSAPWEQFVPSHLTPARVDIDPLMWAVSASLVLLSMSFAPPTFFFFTPLLGLWVCTARRSVVNFYPAALSGKLSFSWAPRLAKQDDHQLVYLMCIMVVLSIPLHTFLFVGDSFNSLAQRFFCLGFPYLFLLHEFYFVMEDIDHNIFHGSVKLQSQALCPRFLLKLLKVFWQLGIAPLHGRIPYRYHIHHVWHHEHDASQDDLESTLDFDRRSIWDLMRFVVRYNYFLILPLYALPWLVKNARYLDLFFITALHTTWFLALTLLPNKHGFVFVLLCFAHANRAAFDAWYWHVLCDPNVPKTSHEWHFTSSIWLLDQSWCDADNHIQHHMTPELHWSGVRARANAHWNEFDAAAANVFELPPGTNIMRLLIENDLESVAGLLLTGASLSQQEKVELLRTRCAPCTPRPIRAWPKSMSMILTKIVLS